MSFGHGQLSSYVLHIRTPFYQINVKPEANVGGRGRWPWFLSNDSLCVSGLKSKCVQYCMFLLLPFVNTAFLLLFIYLISSWTWRQHFTYFQVQLCEKMRIPRMNVFETVIDEYCRRKNVWYKWSLRWLPSQAQNKVTKLLIWIGGYCLNVRKCLNNWSQALINKYKFCKEKGELQPFTFKRECLVQK